MSPQENVSDFRYYGQIVTLERTEPTERDGTATSRRSDDGGPPTAAAARTENILLRARVEALERALADSRAENREVIDRYEALLSERRSRCAESGRAASDFGGSSTFETALGRVRAWASRRR